MPEVNVSSIITTLIAPAILISAAGSLLISIYNRLNACIARIRYFDQRIQELIEKKLAGHVKPKLNDLYNRQIRSIKTQTTSIIERAGLLRNVIYMYEITILCMIITGLMAALSLVSPVFTSITLATIVIGMLFLMTGVIYSIKEANMSLGPVELEFFNALELAMSTSQMEVDDLTETDHIIRFPGA